LELPIDPQAGRPRTPPPKSHTVRNTILATVGFSLLCGGLFVAAHKLGQRSADESLAAQAPTKPRIPEPPPVQATEPVKEEPKESSPAQAPVIAPDQAPLEEAVFQLTTTPPGAEAVFDRNQARKCTSPCSITLPVGRHTFVVSHAGYRDAQRIIEVPRDTGEIVDLVKTSGTLSVITNPPGLAVIVDGQEQRQKTPANITLPVGQHRVQVIKGNDKQEFSVDIADGLLSSKFIDWTQ
jgi:hypothetical protein